MILGDLQKLYKIQHNHQTVLHGLMAARCGVPKFGRYNGPGHKVNFFLTVSPALNMSFPCSHCEQTFENAKRRNHHHWSLHCPEFSNTLDGNEYTIKWQDTKLHCPVDQCEHSYPTREAFLRHVRVEHSGPSIAPPSPVGSSQHTICKRQRSSPSGSKLYPLLHSQGLFVSQRARRQRLLSEIVMERDSTTHGIQYRIV